jgi:hypothetical protein
MPIERAAREAHNLTRDETVRGERIVFRHAARRCRVDESEDNSTERALGLVLGLRLATAERVFTRKPRDIPRVCHTSTISKRTPMG